MPQEAPRREREHAERQHAEEPERREVERLEAAREGAEAGAARGAAREVEEEERPPFPDYRRRTAEELVKRVRQLPVDKLDALEQYERAHKGRKTILEAVRRRREQISNP